MMKNIEKRDIMQCIRNEWHHATLWMQRGGK